MTHSAIIADSGVPEGSTGYTTLVLFHGYAWTSETFRKMLPLAKASNARLILVNRRDFAGAAPFTLWERTDLFAAVTIAETNRGLAQEKVLTWMRQRAREVYGLLVHIVTEYKIPLARPEENTGGIVVGGWSFGTTLMTALLAFMASFPQDDVDLRRYLRRVVFLDPPDYALGLSLQTPMSEPEVDALPDAQRSDGLEPFYTGYFKHGDFGAPDTYATTPLPASEAVPTWNRLTSEDVESMYDPVPGDVRGGTDYTLRRTGILVGAFDVLRQGALHLPDPEGDGWDAVEVRHVWGDHSLAAMVSAMYELRSQLEKDQAAGIRVRTVTFARIDGRNHFMSWDLPERTLDAILRA